MLSPVHEFDVLIIERHLDTFGHVNNSTYLDLLEAARWDWITSNGYGLKEIRDLGQGPTILEIQLRFKRELLNRQRIRIKSWVVDYPNKVGTVMQQMWNEAGDLCCEATFKIGLFDLRSRKLIEPTGAWKRAVGVG
jgi:thioesterase III